MLLSKVKIPGVTSTLYEQILTIVSFEIIPESYYSPLLEYILDDLPSDYIFNDKVAQGGYETGYILVSMFLAFLFLSLYLLKAFGNFVLAHLCKNVGICKARVEISRQQLKELPGELIRLFIELCLDISVCGSIEILMR